MNKKILIADDQPYIIRIVKDKLAEAGYEVIAVDNGIEAVDIAKDIIPDLVLLDVTMPGIDGFEVCRILKSSTETAEIPVFMLTARGQAKDLEEGNEVGADRYINKPFSPRALLKEVRETLGA